MKFANDDQRVKYEQFSSRMTYEQKIWRVDMLRTLGMLDDVGTW